MEEKLIDRIATDIAAYLLMSCSTDVFDSITSLKIGIARFLNMEYGMLDRMEEEFERIGEAVGDPIGASFGNVATEVTKMAVREDALKKALADLYDAACNGALSDDLLCMQEAERLLEQ